MKKRALWITIVAVIVVLFGVIVWRFVSTNNKEEGENKLVITDLPNGYCPTNAWLLVRFSDQTAANFDRQVTVEDCDTIDLDPAFSSKEGDYVVTVKLPRALAFSVEISTPVQGEVSYAPELGDATGDNIIDKTDEDLVSANLFKLSNANADAVHADIDGDGEVTVVDLSLVKLHQGVGAKRPDNAEWELK